MTLPLTKEQVDLAKATQRLVIAECDKAIADLQRNIAVLQDLIVQQGNKKKMAQDTLSDLENDFPMVQSVTTTSGNLEATSIVDSSLIGSDVPMVGKSLKIHPDTPNEDVANIVEFKKDKGEVVVGKALKGGQVVKGVPFKVLEIIPSSEAV